MENKIKLKIQNAEDRENMVLALTNAGYKTWVEVKEEDTLTYEKEYFIVFELTK